MSSPSSQGLTPCNVPPPSFPHLLRAYSSESNATNKARLSVLQARDSHLENLFEAAREKLVGLSKDEKKYAPLLKDLITQGLLRLMEKKVTVTCRDKDESLVKKAADEAKKQYKEKSGRDVEIEVVKGLNKDSNGGVLLAGHGGRIKVDNTLDERMKLLEELVSKKGTSLAFRPRVIRKWCANPVYLSSFPDAPRDPARPVRCEPQQEVLQLKRTIPRHLAPLWPGSFIPCSEPEGLRVATSDLHCCTAFCCITQWIFVTDDKRGKSSCFWCAGQGSRHTRAGYSHSLSHVSLLREYI